MKKFIALVLAATMIVAGNLQSVVHAEWETLLDESFDVSSPSELSSNWSFDCQSGAAAPTEFTPRVNQYHQLELDPQEGNYGMVRAIYTFPKTLRGTVKISYKVRPAEGISTLVSLSNNSNWITTFFEDNSLSIQHSGVATVPYTIAEGLSFNKKFYNVEVYIDFTGKKFKTIVTDGSTTWESTEADIKTADEHNKKLYFRVWGNSNYAIFDNIKVEQIPLGVEIKTGKDGNIFDQTDNVSFSVKVGNGVDTETSGKLVWEIENDYTGEKKFGEKTFTVPATTSSVNGTKEFTITPNIEKFGTYTMTAHLKYLKDGVYIEDNEPRILKFSKILASNNGERNENFGFATSNITASPRSASKSFDIMQKAGAMGIRFIPTWQSCTVTDGSAGTTVPSSSSQSVFDEIESRGAKSIITLAYGNTKLIDQNGKTPDSWRAPKSNADIEKFGNYCRDIADLTKDYGEYYEIWNEWDGGFNPDGLGVSYYVKILKKAYEKIKEVNPNAKVLANSFGENAYFQSALNAGVYEYCDGFVMHGYMQQSYFPNSEWLTKYKDVRLKAIRDYEKSKGYSTRKNMYFDENGISTATDWDYAADSGHNWRTVTESVQAEIVPKYVAFARVYDLTDQIYWFNLFDSGVDNSDKSDKWGVMYYPSTIDTPFQAKPAYASIAAMNKLMNGGITATSWNKIETTEVRDKRVQEALDQGLPKMGNINCYTSCAYAFQRGADDGLGNNLAVLWSESNRNYTLKLGCKTVDMYDLFGNKTQLSSADGIYKIPVNDTLVYLAGDFTSFEAVGASISVAEYDADKNIVHIAGFADGVNTTVNADIYKNGQIVKQVPVKITGGTFDKLFSITEAGTYTIRLGSYAQTEITVSPTAVEGKATSVIGGVSVYLDRDMNICINGTITGFADDENVSVIIVPSGEAVTQSNILYINQLDTENDGSFSDIAELYSLDRDVDIYIGASNAQKAKSDFEYDGVYKVKSLDFSNGSTLSVSAIVYNTTDVDKEAKIFISQYDEYGRLIDASSSPIVLNHSEATPQVVELSAAKNANAVSFKSFVWDITEGNMEPLSGVIDFERIVPQKFAGEPSFHTELMSAYLDDSYDNIANYVDGTQNVDKPLPITFRWSWKGKDTKPSAYTLAISENADMSNSKEYIADTEACDVYNLKVNTQYYWRVTAQDSEGKQVTSKVATLKTENQAPRNILVNGIQNVRDIGGWDTSDEKQVKQGYLYRSFRLSYISNENLAVELKNSGIATMRNDLGIKSEIDLRKWSEMPEEYTDSVLGSDINYYRTPMGYTGDYLESNKEAIQDIFEILSNSENYPIVYHCSAGADRTGVITYLINGLLGVSKEDLLRDYLITNFANTAPPRGEFRPLTRITTLYVKTLDEYRGNTLSEKIYNYLNEVIEVPTEQLDFVINYLK